MKTETQKTPAFRLRLSQILKGLQSPTVMGKADKERLIRTLNSHLNTIHETFQVPFSDRILFVKIAFVLMDTQASDMILLFIFSLLDVGSKPIVFPRKGELGGCSKNGRPSLQAGDCWYVSASFIITVSNAIAVLQLWGWEDGIYMCIVCKL